MTSYRVLDQEEEAIFAALQAGARRAIDSGAAVAEVRWDDFGEDAGSWPQFVVRGRGPAATVAAWFWPNERRRGNAVKAALCIGEPAIGIVWDVGQLTLDDLADLLARIVEAIVEGRATYKPERADPESYEDEIEEGSLSVLLKVRSSVGDWAGSLRGFLENTAEFRAVTGLPIDDQLGETHPVPAFSI